MIKKLKESVYRLLKWSEKYTKTDMVYFASSNFWINVSRFISIGTGMMLTYFFANFLTPEVFGTYKYVLAAGGLVAAFSMNGFGVALARAVVQGKENVIPAMVRSATLWSLPASLGALAVSVYYFSQGNQELGFAFLFVAVTNSFSNGIGITKGVWQAKGDFRLATFIGIPKILIPFIVILLTAFFTRNAVWVVGAYFFSNVVVSWLGYRFMLWWFKVRSSSNGVAETIRYGKQISALGIFQLAGGQLDQLLLWHFTTPSTLAIYALAYAPVAEAQNLLNNFLSILFNKLAAKTKGEAYRAVPLRLRQMLLVSAVLAVIYIIAIPFLFKYLFPKYMASVLVSQVLALTILFQPRMVIETLFSAHAEMGNRAKVIGISQVVDFALSLALIPFFGLWGVVAATILSDAGTAVTFYIMYRKSARTIAAERP